MGNKALPPGVKCDDCGNAPRCFAFGLARPGDTACHTFPIRFRPPAPRGQ